MARERLGLYFGDENITIVEVAGTQVRRSVRFPLPRDTGPGSESQAMMSDASLTFPGGDVQLVASIAEALRDNKIEAKKTFLGFSNKNQFIRGFQMLLLSKQEMDTGVLFEVKKYIPFRTEDLVYDYQQRSIKKSSKMDILFVAATRNTLETNLAILNQAGLEILSIEPASLALTRLLALTRQFNPKLSLALVMIDGHYLEFSVVDKGFPCFSRDINLLPSSGILESVKTEEPGTLPGRLTSEVRVSLDFFRRQFSGSSIDKILFLAKNASLQEELTSGLSEDLGLPVERVELVELEKNKAVDTLQDLDGFKAYALALKDTIKINLSVDLARKKIFQPIITEEAPKKSRPFIFDLGVLKRPVAIVLLLMALAYGWPLSELNKARLKLNQLRKEVLGIGMPELKNLSLDALKNTKTNYASKIDIIEKLINSRFKITPFWNVLPVAVEKGLWLENLDISISEGRQSLSLRGAAYFGDEGLELNAAHAFQDKLENNPDFMRGLKKLELKSLNRNQVQVGSESYMVTYFDISAS